MTDTRFTVNHAHLVTDKPFEDVTETFQRQLGRFDPDVRKVATESGDTEAAKTQDRGDGRAERLHAVRHD